MKLLLSALLLALASNVQTYRLPGIVTPTAYDIHLTLTEELFTAESDEYSGYEIITIQVSAVTNQIQIHAAHNFVNITSAHVNNVDVAAITVNDTTDIVTLTTPNNLAIGTHSLYIIFTSRASTEDMYGFYKSSYTYNNQVKYLVTTQFQPVYARRAFPCFDEPAHKATFDIYITNPIALTALSNMPGEAYDTSDVIGDDPNLPTTHFPITPVMSSYLVAFIVSEFTCTNAGNIETNAVPYRVCSRDETTATRAWSVEIGPPLLRSLNNITNYNYGTMGFPKMDQVAIPDFAAGAMENWALVTYREQYLLYDAAESTNMDQQFIATIISHEFAHQWFGNLVTLEWWSEMFINEGWATYFEYFTTHDVFPEWELDKQFVVRVLQRVLETDSFESSLPLQSPANSDAQVMAKFSQISYLKGGSVLRMLEHIIGSENFVRGIRSFLVQYASQNVLPVNLWDSFHAELTGADVNRLPESTTVAQIMENWVINPGYPLIDVRLVNTAVVITQTGRFLLNGEDSTARWYVPISYATNQSPNFENTHAQEWLLLIGYVEIPFVDNADGFIILNNHATGFYRVNYNNLWENLATALQAQSFSGIPEVNRASIVDDAFHLARTNHLNYTRLFNVIEFLRNDVSHHAWYPALSGFNFLLRRTGQDSELGQAIVNHQLELLSNIYATVPWTNLADSNHAYTLKQVDILTVACRLGLQNCVNQALERFGEFRLSGVRPRKNLRSIVYCNALRYGNSVSDWLLLWNAYHTTEIASEKVRILSALGCTQNEGLLQYYLELSLEETSGIRPQDALSVFTAVYTGSTVGIDIAFKFLQEHHLEIEERYQSMNALSNMISGLAERFTNESHIEELRHFINNGALHEDFHNAASAALAAAEANHQWLGESLEELNDYYDLNPVVTGPPTTASPETSPVTTPPTTTPDGAAAVLASIFLIVLSVVFSMS